MNAIVSLCHFCEAHGPRPLFCTFTTDNESHTTESSKANVQCNGCTSLGPETVLVSRDNDGTIFCSRETVPNTEVTTFLRQAAIRSITCEVSWSKEGGVVYFSDIQGHVLSFTFQVRDTRARGLKRWFAIVVLMKDKMLLLNLIPLLSEHMQKISKELQDLADVVFNDEQNICSQRALRLRTGRNDFGQSRSLMQLTNDENVFKRLHSQFTWMLKAGAHTYSETLYTSQDLLNKLQENSIKGSIFDSNVCKIETMGECLSLRALEKLLSVEIFKIVLYNTLCGVNIYVRTNFRESQLIVKSISRLLPTSEMNAINVKICENNVEPSLTVCVLEEIETKKFICKWSGTLPVKCPTIMNRIQNAMSNDKFNDDVLHQHVKSLQLEWLGTARAIKSAIASSSSKSDAVAKLKQVLGVSPNDELLLNFWMNTFC